MGSGALDLPARYAALLAASACLNIWLANTATASGFLAGTGWLAAALGRLAGLLGIGPENLTAEAAGLLYTELRRRCDDGQSLELASMAAGE
jgi:hypothetical protein